jgi:hypothetical protein
MAFKPAQRFLSGSAGTLLLTCLLSLCAVFAAIPPELHAEERDLPKAAEQGKGGKGQSAIVFVIDKSSSMAWIFDSLRLTLKSAITKSKQGDCLAIVLFGDEVSTLVSYTKLNETKKRLVINLLDSVHPDSLYTNMAAAVKRGTEILCKYFRENMAETYVLVLVTDGKDHPAPGCARDYTIEEAMTQYPDFLPGQQWCLRYIAIEGQIYPELLALLRKSGGDFFDAEKIAKTSQTTQEAVLESIIENPQDWAILNASITDHIGGVKVKESGGKDWRDIPKERAQRLFPGDQVSVAPDSKAVITFGSLGTLGLKDNTRVGLNSIETSPLKARSTIKFKLENGSVWNAVTAPPNTSVDYEVVTPIAIAGIRGTVFRVLFDSRNQTEDIGIIKGSVEVTSPDTTPAFPSFKLQEGTYSVIRNGEKPTAPSPLPAEIMSDWLGWAKALLEKKQLSRINFTQVLALPLRKEIKMGPIKPGAKFFETCRVELKEKYWGESPIIATANLALPPGATIEVNPTELAENELVRDFLISIKCSGFLKFIGQEQYSGEIRFSCDDPSVRIAEPVVAIAVSHHRPSFLIGGRDLKIYLKPAVAAVVSAIVLALAWVAVKKRGNLYKLMRAINQVARGQIRNLRLLRFLRARPIGALVLENFPAEGKRTRFDLAELSRLSAGVVVGIGSDPSNSVCIAHPSVRPFHCAIFAGRKRNPTCIYLEPAPDCRVAIHGCPVVHAHQLCDKDKIEIGNVACKFHDTQFHRQVEVHMKNGSVHSGLLYIWDTSQSIFYLDTTVKGREECIAVYFADVSHVRFYRDESERRVSIMSRSSLYPKPKQKKSVKITLHDKRELRGFMHKKFRYKQGPGVFLLPASSEAKIQYTYVPRGSIEKLIIVDAR